MILFFFLNEEQKYHYLYENTTSAKQGKAFYKKILHPVTTQIQ